MKDLKPFKIYGNGQKIILRLLINKTLEVNKFDSIIKSKPLKISFLAVCFLAIMAFGCSETSKEKEPEVSQKVETILPLIDSAYIHQKVSVADSFLSAADVLKFSKLYISLPEKIGLIPSFESFLKIDSVRNAGEYQNYVETLDIGMIKDATALYLENIKLDANTGINLWCIKYSSYEACPYYEGTEVFGTYYTKNGPQKTYLLGVVSTAADPPMGLETYVNSVLKGKSFESFYSAKELDLDEEEAITHSEEEHWTVELP